MELEAPPTQAVLQALRALQSKVDQLERDRDYYAKECDRLSQIHKEELRSLEQTATREREEFTRRQSEMQDTIRQMTDEKYRLQRMLEERKVEEKDALRALDTDHGELRRKALDEQHTVAVESSALSRRCEETERAVETLRSQLEMARRERDVIEASNDRVIRALTDVRSMSGARQGAATGRSSPLRGPTPGRATPRYQNPTMNAMQRGCVVQARHQQHQAQQRRSTTPTRKSGAVIRQPYSVLPLQNGNNMDLGGGEVVDNLLVQLSEESRDLIAQYRALVAQGRDGSGGVSSPEALTENLNALVEAMNRKAEQIRQIQQWRMTGKGTF
eukprot:PhM_4_TR4621/c1_g1_i1/m.43123